MSGMTLANPVSGATPSPTLVSPTAIPPGAWSRRLSRPLIDLAWHDVVGGAQHAFVYEQTPSG